MTTVRGIKVMPADQLPLDSITGAPHSYSLRARVLGNLCGSCDLGIDWYGCQCPPCSPIWRLR